MLSLKRELNELCQAADLPSRYAAWTADHLINPSIAEFGAPQSNGETP